MAQYDRTRTALQGPCLGGAERTTTRTTRRWKIERRGLETQCATEKETKRRGPTGGKRQKVRGKERSLTGSFVGDSAPAPRPDLPAAVAVDVAVVLRPLLRPSSPPKKSRLDGLRSRSPVPTVPAPMPMPMPVPACLFPSSFRGLRGLRCCCCCSDNGCWSFCLDPRRRSDSDGISLYRAWLPSRRLCLSGWDEGCCRRVRLIRLAFLRPRLGPKFSSLLLVLFLASPVTPLSPVFSRRLPSLCSPSRVRPREWLIRSGVKRRG